MPRKNFFDNSIYFRLFIEIAQLECPLIKIPKEIFILTKNEPAPKSNTEEIVKRNKKMSISDKHNYLLSMVTKFDKNKKSLTEPKDRAFIQKKASYYFTQLEEHHLVTSNEEKQKYNLQSYAINWAGLSKEFVNFLNKKYYLNDSKIKGHFLTEHSTEIESTFKRIIFNAPPQYADVKTLNELFNHVFYWGVASCVIKRAYNIKNHSITLLSLSEKTPKPYSAEVSRNLSIALCNIYLNYSLKEIIHEVKN